MIGEGGGDRTIISTNTLDITNVSIVELNALDIMIKIATNDISK